MLEPRALLSAAFGASSYAYTLAETTSASNSANSTYIGTVSVTGDDDEEMMSGVWASNSDFWFSQDVSDSSTYHLYTSVLLDFDSPMTTNPITFNANVGMSGVAGVTITLTDVEEDPVFDSTEWTFSIDEGEHTNVVVGSISATDPQNDSLSYSPTGTGAELFTIDANGQITVSGTLNFESAPTYTLIINVLDMQGSAVEPATVTINVNDVLEDPKFNPMSYTFSVPENATIGTVVGTVLATDPQNDISGYSVAFVGVGGIPPFDVDSLGNIVLVGSLDFGTTPTYTLTVAAYDMQGSGTATLTINVSDVANFPGGGGSLPNGGGPSLNWNPIFLGQTISVSEGDPEVVQSLFALDPDNHYPLTYSVVGTLPDGMTFDGLSLHFLPPPDPNYSLDDATTSEPAEIADT